ncbi:MAG: hypothetical protein IJY09_04210 [Lachnospiraceae bacterium]|nr:hypothetical protein [Lachnospiraceae bacterium]
MVTMKNIRIEDNQIFIDCYKEGLEEGYFSLVINNQTYEIIYSSLDRPSIYSRQVVSKIVELRKVSYALPTEAKSVWC